MIWAGSGGSLICKAVACSIVPGALIAFSGPVLSEDRLKINGIADDERVVVLIDARRAPGVNGCVNDLVGRTKGSMRWRNVLAPGGCNSEIAVLSSHKGFALETIEWTDQTGELKTIALPPIVEVPVSVWIADAAAQARATADMQRAAELYKTNKVGVVFNPTFQLVSANPSAVAVINAGIAKTPDGHDYECKDIAAIQQSAVYTANRLNIYYVSLDIGGRNCAIKQTPACDNLDAFPEGDGNITFIGSTANRASLAHEIGHAFGLRPGPCGGHPTQADDGIPSRNIMSSPGDGADRDQFTLGQVFRMNTQKDQWGGTMLIKNGLRPGPGRECPPRKATKDCPALKTDWQRP